MAYVQVDVDLDDFDTSELVDELCRRMKSLIKRKQLTDKEKTELKSDFKDLSDLLNNSNHVGIEVKTLDDKMKYDHLVNVFNKYTSAQIEAALP